MVLNFELTNYKLMQLNDAVAQVQAWQGEGLKVAFTNGCFDIVHMGHIDYLEKTRSLADKLVLGLNTDASVQRIKGPLRPIQNNEARARLMGALSCIDLVVFFDEETPLELITALKPDILTKGNDYALHNIVGADFVISNGGEVITIPLVEGYSTSILIDKILKAYK